MIDESNDEQHFVCYHYIFMVISNLTGVQNYFFEDNVYCGGIWSPWQNSNDEASAVCDIIYWKDAI